METNLKHQDETRTNQTSDIRDTKSQLPEWHPFAVWRTQIKNEETSKTGSHPVLRSVKT